MAVAIRVIPCLDVDQGRVVKGVNFENLRDAGDPVELAQRYNELCADELTFLDVSASKHGRGTMLDVVRRTADQVFIPLTVGGRSEEHTSELQSRGHLVCRLLLEKKNNENRFNHPHHSVRRSGGCTSMRQERETD